jgi:hypothetical protein
MKFSTNKFLYKYLGLIVILILVIGVGSIFTVQWFIYDGTINPDYFNHISNIYTPIGIVLSAATIILLYVNFRQQQEEFSRINDLNLLVYEKQKIDKLNQKYDSLLDNRYSSNLEECFILLGALYDDLYSQNENEEVSHFNFFDALIEGYNIYKILIALQYLNDIKDNINATSLIFINSETIYSFYSSLNKHAIFFINMVFKFNDYEVQRKYCYNYGEKIKNIQLKSQISELLSLINLLGSDEYLRSIIAKFTVEDKRLIMP